MRRKTIENKPWQIMLAAIVSALQVLKFFVERFLRNFGKRGNALKSFVNRHIDLEL
jgi:hypothetical protein